MENEISLTEKMELILGLDERSGLSDFERNYVSECSDICTAHDPEGILSETSINKINDLHFKFFLEGY